MMDEVPKLWIRLRILVAAVGVLVGLSVFAVFGVQYHNWNAAGWGLLSGIVAAATLLVHVNNARGAFDKNNNRLKTWMLMGCFSQLLGVCGFAVYLTLAIVDNQGLQIYDDGFYLTLVWCFMTWKWGFSLFYYSRSYKRYLEELLLQGS
ncbi:heme transporter hrg1-B-like [Mizuhopecten yessoensis]|uniref:Heme transporter hrg1-B n=1 Tax=Mizuhopecten yessoensis TaxID=6573 RepID=A0A210PSX3_MIZYE|nr:heme transporter hrg1-B-like [Mizuhopecten yessoensis]OWF39588.1 Heme transporter hrg1-B [Mizuhopecten yessoensis]